ncbi:hypothetical protein LSY66_004657 [Salmonella enterica]|uniref:YebO family protein n=1 Tax=Citrobacter freundii TaxID=546 RepID=UPI0012D0FC6B|nr:YebO family protein [Citrobacter freundii]EBC2559924.1 hypothetical protein [Salmonella enterica]EBJ9963386.1 hypothetical protein [Salmonella enterica]EBM7492048.1 hypothetical protein [Salmonella enterica]EBO3610533.1 hypothetical protein [Salmonella enterica]EBU3383324.1 hypothetical protein [Salmonella enterica]
MYSYGIDSTFYVILAVSWLLGLIIAFFVIRYAVRANEQIEVLKEISKKQNVQIDLLLAVSHKDGIQEQGRNSEKKTDEDYLEEARRKAGLI